jgi:hypothetical protein
MGKADWDLIGNVKHAQQYNSPQASSPTTLGEYVGRSSGAQIIKCEAEDSIEQVRLLRDQILRHFNRVFEPLGRALRRAFRR